MSSAINETVIQRNPKDKAEEKERQKELVEENKNAFHDAMIKNSGLLSATLMLNLLGGCCIFTGSAMAYQMAAAGTFEAAASVHDNLSFEQSFVNVTSSVLSSGVSSLTGRDKESMQLAATGISSFVLTLAQKAHTESEKKESEQMPFSELVTISIADAGLDTFISYDNTKLENAFSISSDASQDFFEFFTAWADDTGKDVADNQLEYLRKPQ